MNDHWLKERYKDKSTADLQISKMFIDNLSEIRYIEAELKRREQETALIQEDTP